MKRCPHCGGTLEKVKPLKGKQALAYPFSKPMYWKVLVLDKKEYEWLCWIGSSKQNVLSDARSYFRYYPWVYVLRASPITQRVFKSRKYESVPASIRVKRQISDLEKLVWHVREVKKQRAAKKKRGR